MIHTYASLEHYAQHLAPIWAALPTEVRGERWAARAGQWWGSPVPRYPPPPGIVMVSAACDTNRVPGRALVYVEHGAGQAYPGDPRSADAASYSGGAGHDRAVLFVAPGELVAARWRAAYPNIPVAVVGCPRLDRWHQYLRKGQPNGSVGPTVAVTFHWDCGLIPETTSALRHYERALPALRDAVRAAGGDLLGHGHPRAWRRLRDLWGRLGVRCTADPDVVFDEADLLVADNTSLAYEFASLDRPVVTLNAPWYRRDVHHGLRFWDLIPGVHVDDPADLTAVVTHALTDPPEARQLRLRAVAAVYAHTDGHAAARAAAAIVNALEREPSHS